MHAFRIGAVRARALIEVLNPHTFANETKKFRKSAIASGGSGWNTVALTRTSALLVPDFFSVRRSSVRKLKLTTAVSRSGCTDEEKRFRRSQAPGTKTPTI